MTRLHGLGVSTGTARGIALVLQQPADIVHYAIDASRVAHEQEVLRRACDSSRGLHENWRRCSTRSGSCSTTPC